jgi:hypothetical protein
MRTVQISLAILVFVMTCESFVLAEEKADGKATTKQSSFDRIKSLSGDWEVTRGPDGHGQHGATVFYKVTAAGSAVQETLFGGTDHEMITLYYVEDGKLALTHYCMLQNRPLMREEKTSNPAQIVLVCPKAENAKIEAEDHMHQVTYTFIDADHVKADWVLFKGGKPDSTHTFELARRKK